MDYIINHLNDPEDFYNIPKHYKTIPGLKQNELSYYLLILNNNNDLKEVVEFIANKYYPEAYDLKEVVNDQDKAVIILNIKIDEENFCKAAFNWNKSTPFVYVMTDYGKKRKILERFIWQCYPLVERASLKSYQIVNQIIHGFLEEEYSLSSSMVSEKKWWKKEKKIRPSLDYPSGIPIEDVIKDLGDKDAFINSINLSVYNNHGLRLCKFFVSRKGILKFIDGDFSLFKEKVLDKSLDILSSDYGRLNNREQKGEILNTITVDFSVKRSNPLEIVKQFTNLLRENRNLSLLTHHNGNPFFYADITDIKEGSSFGLMFESRGEQSKMTLLPQKVSSPVALSNFLDFIFYRFGEGEIAYQDGI